jgi:hypothetical protein
MICDPKHDLKPGEFVAHVSFEPVRGQVFRCSVCGKDFEGATDYLMHIANLDCCGEESE